MARKHENTGFECARCRARVLPLSNGSYRNHCPFCLWSLHVDARKPGDRASVCCGLMKPVAVVRKHGVLQVIHRCTACGKTQPNRIARDTDQPDDFDLVLEMLSTGARFP